MILARIVEVSVQRASYDDDASPLALHIRAKVDGEDRAPPYTQILLLDNGSVEQFAKSFAPYPIRNVEDFVGLEVKIVDRLMTGTDTKRIYPKSEREKISAEFDQDILTSGGRRLMICRTIDRVKDIIAKLDDAEPLEKNELNNLATVLLRMIIFKNDGGGSEQKLQIF